MSDLPTSLAPEARRPRPGFATRVLPALTTAWCLAVGTAGIWGIGARNELGRKAFAAMLVAQALCLLPAAAWAWVLWYRVRESRNTLSMHTGTGRVHVTLAAIEDVARTAALRVSSVKYARCELRWDREGGLAGTLYLRVRGGAELREAGMRALEESKAAVRPYTPSGVTNLDIRIRGGINMWD